MHTPDAATIDSNWCYVHSFTTKILGNQDPDVQNYKSAKRDAIIGGGDAEGLPGQKGSSD